MTPRGLAVILLVCDEMPLTFLLSEPPSAFCDNCNENDEEGLGHIGVFDVNSPGDVLGPHRAVGLLGHDTALSLCGLVKMQIKKKRTENRFVRCSFSRRSFMHARIFVP